MANTFLPFLLMSICILVMQMTQGVHGAITVPPLNRVVYEGATNTKITCESNSPSVCWQFYPFAYAQSYDYQVIIVFYLDVDSPFDAWFGIDQSQGTEVLVVFNATLTPSPIVSTAGFYNCIDYDGDFSAHLVVVRTDPICSSNFTQSSAMLQPGDVIQLSCTLVYGSTRSWPIDAVMTWSVNGQPVPAGNAIFSINNSPTEVTATSTLLISENFDSTYECATTFGKPPDLGPTYASNAPDYFKTCTISRNQCLSNVMNIAVYEGQLNTIMKLSTDPQSVTWSVLPTSEEPFLQTIIDIGFNKNPSLAQLYDVYQTGLLIKNATTVGDPISTAGLYVGQCADKQDLTGAKLLVVRTGPQCSSISINSTSSNTSCSVTYADSTLHPIYPTITWRLNGIYLQSHTPPRERIDLFVFYATSTITTNSGSSNDNYQCELTFDAPTDIQYDWIATNAPTFRESCSTNP